MVDVSKLDFLGDENINSTDKLAESAEFLKKEGIGIKSKAVEEAKEKWDKLGDELLQNDLRSMYSSKGANVPKTLSQAVDPIFGTERRKSPALEGVEEISSLDILKRSYEEPQAATRPLAERLAGLSERKTPAALAAHLFALDDAGKAKVFKEVLGTESQLDEESGSTILTFPSGEKRAVNLPGLSQADFEALLADTALFGPSSAIAKAAPTRLTRVGLGGLASGLTELGRQKSMQGIGAQEDIDKTSVGLAFGGGVLGEWVQTAFGKGGIKKAEKAFGTKKERAGLVPPLVEEAQKIKEETGQLMFRPQQTGDLFELEEMSKAAMETTEGQLKLRKQNKNATQSVVNFVKEISDSKNAKNAYVRVRDSAKKAIKDLEDVRSTAASPHYEQALKDKRFYSAKKTKDYIRKELADAAGEYESDLRTFQKFLTPKSSETGKPVTRGLRISQLHRAYKNIGKKIEGYRTQGRSDMVQELRPIREMLADEIATFNKHYDRGREVYKRLSPQVDRIKDGITGDIAKLKDQQVSVIRTKLFGDNLFDASEEAVRQARKEISDVDPDAWNGLIRKELTRRINKRVEDDVFSISNRPGSFYQALAGQKGKDIAVIRSALNDEQRKRYNYLLKGLKRQSKGRPGGSPTEIRQQITKKWEGGGIEGALQNVLSPKETVSEAAKDARYNINRDAITSIIFDEKWEPDWKILKRLTPTSKKAEEYFTGMLKRAASEISKTTAKTRLPEIGTAAAETGKGLIDIGRDYFKGGE